MAEHVVRVHVVHGAVRREWCDRCLTSAVVRINLYAFVGDNPEPVCIGVAGGCTRCDPDLFGD